MARMTHLHHSPPDLISQKEMLPVSETVIFGPFGPNLGHETFFYKNLASSVTRYKGQLSSCTISEKLMIQS